jgi:hypothetical protein
MQAPTSEHMFDEVVCLKFGSGWCYIESVEQALACLQDRFDDHADPSWQRACSTLGSFLAGRVGIKAAKSAFIVAAMAAGIQYELAASLAIVERHVEEAATDGLLTILLEDGG